MAYMTDEEVSRLDEKWTKNPPKPGPNGTGYFTRCKNEAGINAALSVTIDSITANYLTTKAIASHKTPAEVISDMVQRELVAAL